MHPQLFGQVLKKSNNQSFEGRCVPNRMYACAFTQDANMAICDLSVIGLFKQLKTCIFEHFGREKRNDTCAALDEPKDGACTACREDRGPCPEGPGWPERNRAAGRTPILVSLRSFDRYSNTFVDIPSRPGSPNHISAGQALSNSGLLGGYRKVFEYPEKLRGRTPATGSPRCTELAPSNTAPPVRRPTPRFRQNQARKCRHRGVGC